MTENKRGTDEMLEDLRSKRIAVSSKSEKKGNARIYRPINDAINRQIQREKSLNTYH